MVDEKFRKKCLEDESNSTRLLKSPTMRKRTAEKYSKQSEYHERTARNLLNTDTPLIAVAEAYYTMMHKANQALALAGYDIGSHLCTLIGLSRILDKPELADRLRQAGERRLETDYELDPEKPPYNERATRRFVEEAMSDFLSELEGIIEELRSD